ncbi:hypothetical protein LguiA_006706 [Lonicera macranthoides]
MAKELFKEGAMVEVSLEHEGFRGSWYTATILRPHTKKTNNNHLYLEFHTLISEDKATKSLREFVDEQNLVCSHLVCLVQPRVLPDLPRRRRELQGAASVSQPDEWISASSLFPKAFDNPTIPTFHSTVTPSPNCGPLPRHCKRTTIATTKSYGIQKSTNFGRIYLFMDFGAFLGP